MAETINMPKLGFDMAEGKLIRWLKKVDEKINKGEVLAEIETDKATVEVESPAGGVVRRLLVDEGAIVAVGLPIAIVGTPDENIEEPAAQAAIITTPEAGKHPDLIPTPVLAPVPTKAIGNPLAAGLPAPSVASRVQELPSKASPLAKHLARENKMELGSIKGSGPGGRIVRRDIEARLAAGPNMPQAANVTPSIPAPHADETVSLSRLRLAIARRMVESKANIPHFYVTHEYRMDALLEMRKQFNALLPDEEKVSINDFIVKAVGLTLRQFPNLNATFNGSSVVRHGAVHIGIAVSVEGGLLTVVCRDADQKPLRQISTETRSMAVRAREGKVRPEEIEGSTFSISNLGMFDVENFQAIINPPEVAILAIGSARELAVVEEGAIRPGWRMKATLSVDHRVSDGAEGARFMQALGEYLEHPLRLVL
jgi:pyruvate dehydrogenase E2 component (dihydrolipoamide acetyltransferase)